MPNILKSVSTVVIPATKSQFSAKKEFRTNTGLPRYFYGDNYEREVKINHVVCRFRTHFGDKVEEPSASHTLCYANLQERATDESILAEIGGEEKAETTLTAMFRLMEKQNNGQNGVLLTGHGRNVFYVRNQNGTLCSVVVGWNDNGWHIDAEPAKANPQYGWIGEIRVFYPSAKTEPAF